MTRPHTNESHGQIQAASLIHLLALMTGLVSLATLKPVQSSPLISTVVVSPANSNSALSLVLLVFVTSLYPETAFLRSAGRDNQSASMDPYVEDKHDQLSHRYSGSDWPPRDTNPRSSPFIDHTVQKHSGFVPGKQQNADLSRYHDTETPVPAGFQPEQLTHLASSLPRQQQQVQNTPNQPERYAPEGRASFSHLQHAQTPSIPQLVTPQNQNVQIQSSNSQQQEETEANPQKRLQATLQLAAALLQQIQQAKPS